MLALAVPRGAMRSLVWLGHRYLVPRGDGRLLVGATVEEPRLRRARHRGRDRTICSTPRSPSRRRSPGFSVVETWAGLRPGSHDGRPYIGATALDGYVVASGHYRNGILLTPITARAIAALICEGSDDTLAPFAPGRAGVAPGDAAVGEAATPAANTGRVRITANSEARVQITVNGEDREIADGLTVEALLGTLDVRRDGSAVALNDDVVPRARHAQTALHDGDRLEIIVAVAGG